MKNGNGMALLFFIAGAFITIISILKEKPVVFIVGIVIFIIAIVFLLTSFLYIKNIFRRILPLCRKKRNIKNLGVFGRDALIDKILEWHNRDTTNKIALISGAAGAGKTTLANALKKSVNDPDSIIIVSKGSKFYSDVEDMKGIKDNCIIVFDYVLEALKQIECYIKQLMDNKCKNKMISIILLERDAATNIVGQIMKNKEKPIFRINLDDYKLSEESLVEIIEYNVKDVEDKEAKNTLITRDAAIVIAKLIIDYIDQEFRRPIFASILATIYRREEHFDYSVRDRDTLFSEYWEVVTGFRKFLKEEDINTDKTINYVNYLKENVKLTSLFTTITGLKIRCCPFGERLEIKLLDSSDQEENNEEFSLLINSALQVPKIPNSNIIDWLRYFYYHNYKICNEPAGIYILPLNLDMFSSWILYRSIEENPKKLSIWLEKILKTTDNRYYSESYMFVLRASEIFGYEIFEFFMDMGVPEYSQLFRWKRDFAADINFILDIKSKELLDKKFQFFEKRYNKFCATIHNTIDKEHITRDIIDMIEAAEEQPYDYNSYQRLLQWKDSQKEKLENAGLRLK